MSIGFFFKVTWIDIVKCINPTYKGKVFLRSFALKSDTIFTKSEWVQIFSNGDGLNNTHSIKCVFKMGLDNMQYDSDM